MKFIYIALFAAAFAAGEQPTGKPPAKAAPRKSTAAKSKTAPKIQAKAAPKKPAPVTIPANAREVSPGIYRWIDPKGVAWVYHQTPFGIMRGVEPPDSNRPDPVPTDWKVSDDEGDSVTFERPYPFGGTNRWTRKKTELTETEIQVWKRAQGLRGSPTSGKS
ncbi:MAG TPA: hypothetical protein VM120_06575 [Bryobacteraceae bacterium]|nr:hypothetical protein [Bryobacteraceae bacterium]